MMHPHPDPDAVSWLGKRIRVVGTDFEGEVLGVLNDGQNTHNGPEYIVFTVARLDVNDLTPADIPCACGNAYTGEPRIHCGQPGKHNPSPSPTCAMCHGPLMAWCPATDDAGPLVPCEALRQKGSK